MRRSTKKVANSARHSAPLRLTAASWLSDSSLLLLGSHDPGLAPLTNAYFVCGDSSVELRVSGSKRLSSIAPDAESQVGWLAIAHGRGCLRGNSAFGLTLCSASESYRVEADSVALAITDLRTLVRNHFTVLDPGERNSIVELVASNSANAENDATNRLRLSRSTNLIRDMLRERLPMCELKPNRIEGLAVETVIALDDMSFYIEGWLCDGESAAVRLTAVSPEGARIELLERLFRYRRPDAEDFFKVAIGEQHGKRYGFICYFRANVPSLLPVGWLVEVETAAGTAMEVMAPSVITDGRRIRAELLNDVILDRNQDEELRRTHIGPALSALQLDRSRRVQVEMTAEFGKQPANPRVSILVPLYGRIDLLEHQMAQLGDDPDMREVELIYVLDSPELKSDLLTMADGLFQLYRLPFKVLILSVNAGFSTANNVAAARARAGLLLLLNSDVVPIDPGWLTKLTAFYETLEKPGALGPKLIYEDNSLQHAGLFFERVQGSSVWMNEHYYKGLHSDLPAANVAREVPAVTGACLMIDAGLYEAAGGLSSVYIQGDYEDSDLCLRLSQAGRKNWYFPQVELYHLEGQSYASAARQVNYEYNRWLFNETWAEAISKANLKAGLLTGPAPGITDPKTGRIRRVKASGNGASDDSITTRAKMPNASTLGDGAESADEE